MTAGTFAIELNGRSYRWPRRPVVVVCVDGFDPAYLEDGLRLRDAYITAAIHR